MRSSIQFCGVFLLFPLLSLKGLAESAEQAEPAFVSPTLLSPEAFSYPIEGFLQGKPTGGVAKLLVHLDEQGSVVDGICLEATSHIFAEAATRGLFASHFNPAMEDGSPIAVRTELIVYFEINGVRMINAMDDVALRQHSMDGEGIGFAVTPPPQLDEPIQVAERGTVYGLKDEEGNKLNGKVWVRLFIDADGQVRLPEVERSSNSILDAHALQTIKQWKFQGPRKDGDPTITRVVIPMSF
jgi:TonB family protein